MLPLLPERWTVHRWTCWTSGGHYPTAHGSLLPLFRSGVPLHLAIHHIGQRFVDAVPGSGEYRCAVQGLRCAVPIHLQRAPKLRVVRARRYDGLRIDGMN
jgi:hypothetical protein